MRKPDPAQTTLYIKWAESMLARAQACKALVPTLTNGLPVTEQQSLIASYRRDLRETIKSMEKLVSSLKAGNLSDAAKIVKNLKKQRNMAHAKYQEE